MSSRWRRRTRTRTITGEEEIGGNAADAAGDEEDAEFVPADDEDGEDEPAGVTIGAPRQCPSRGRHAIASGLVRPA
jgi:hypothetical protein